MIGLLIGQLTARWGQALGLLSLSLAATFAAVSGPLFAVAIDRAAIDREVARASNPELVVSLPLLASSSQDGGQTGGDDVLTGYTEARDVLTGFTPLTTTSIQVQGLIPDAPASEANRLLARDGFCRHVTFRAGRCPVGTREVALPSALAKQAEVSAGEQVVLTPVQRISDDWEPDGPPTAVAVVGVFDATDPGDPYWRPLDPIGVLGTTPAMLTNPTALRTLEHERELVQLDAILPTDPGARGALDPARVPRVAAQLDRADAKLRDADPLATGVGTELRALLDRITAHGEQARALLPIAAAPLVALCWLVVHLSVARAVAGRRHEVGVVAVRGARYPTRLAAVAIEPLLPIVLGIPAGYLLARLVVTFAVPGGSGPGAGEVPGTGLLLPLVVAGVGTVVAGLLALRREIGAPVAQLLRRVPPRTRRWTLATGPVLALALAAALGADLLLSGEDLSGLRVATPAAVMVAVVVLGALIIRPFIELIGRWTLRRGRLGPALAALHLARWSGAVGLLPVLGLVFGAAGFAVAGSSVAADGRSSEVELTLGASQVLQVPESDRERLLTAVRAADPEGRHAMAVAEVPGLGDGPPALAVDAERFADVALSGGAGGTEASGKSGGVVGASGLDPAEVAERLRPSAPASIRVTDGELVAELTRGPLTKDGTLILALRLIPDGGDPMTARFGPVTDDESTYTARVDRCPDGCRVAGVAVSLLDAADAEIGVTVHSLRQGDRELFVDGAGDPDWWRVPGDESATERLRVETNEEGLWFWRRYPQAEVDYALLAGDTPYPLPEVVAGGGRSESQSEPLSDDDGQPIPTTTVGRATGLPGVGTSGRLVDLEYATRLGASPGAPRVWLTPDAPADFQARLAEQGVEVSGEQAVGDLREQADRSGAAMALSYYRYAAWFAVLIGLGGLLVVVAVDRATGSRRSADLRVQGVRARTTVAAAVWSYGGIVVAGAILGVAAAAAAWLVAGPYLPLGVDRSLLAAWPPLASVGGPVAVAVGVLLLAAVAGGWWQRGNEKAGE